MLPTLAPTPALLAFALFLPAPVRSSTAMATSRMAASLLRPAARSTGTAPFLTSVHPSAAMVDALSLAVALLALVIATTRTQMVVKLTRRRQLLLAVTVALLARLLIQLVLSALEVFAALLLVSLISVTVTVIPPMAAKSISKLTLTTAAAALITSVVCLLATLTSLCTRVFLVRVELQQVAVSPVGTTAMAM